MTTMKSLKHWMKCSLKCLKTTNDDIIFNVYLIKLCNVKKAVVKTNISAVKHIGGRNIRLTYIQTKSMQNLSHKLKKIYRSHINNSYTYIIYDISECEKNDGIKSNFKSSDFLLNKFGKSIAKEKFFKTHMFFVVNKESEQCVKFPYNDEANYILRTYCDNYSLIWKIISAYIRFHHILMFIDREMLKNKKTIVPIIKALNGDCQAQLKYGIQFEQSNYMLYFLWITESLKNGNYPQYINLDEMDNINFDGRTKEKLYNKLLDYGLLSAAKKLYNLEIKKKNPDIDKIRKYTEQYFKSGELESIFYYAKERSAVLSGYESIVNHKEAMKGFKKLFEYYDSADNTEKDSIRYAMPYVYYAYAAECSVEEEISPDYIIAAKYYKKALNEKYDEFADKIFNIAKEFYIGRYVEKNIEHSIDLMEMLSDKEYAPAREYIDKIAYELAQKEQYAFAERCYKICCKFDMGYFQQYALSRIMRETENL